MGKHTGKSKQPISDSDFQEFKKKINTLINYVPSNDYGVIPNPDTLYVEWRTGGVAGGSCWNDGEDDIYYDIEPDEEPKFTYLHTILEKFYPDITYLQYRALESNCVSIEDRHETDYYGNSNKYRRKTLDLRKLHDFLSSLKKNAEN